jgi:hypothetical protein
MFSRARHVVAIAAYALAAAPMRAGDLNPPAGPVAPTMKTLQQVEPRTPIGPTTTTGDATNTFIISQPGSYYLTGNLNGEFGKNGILITSSNVTLDLNGFALVGVSGSFSGVSVSGFRTNVVIRNGLVSGWASSGVSTQIDSGRIERIVSSENGGDGITNAANAFMVQIVDCEALGNVGAGIRVGNTARISNCAVRRNTGGGIVVANNCLVESCVITSEIGTATDGVSMGSGNIVRGNVISSTTAAGLRITSSRNVVESNLISGTNIGIVASSTGNTISENRVVGAVDAYQLIAGNDLQLIVSQLPESIDWPAHVTISGNLTRTSAGPGITIASSDVTLDLGGYALIGNSTANVTSNGIVVSGTRSNIVVRNGAVRNWGSSGAELSNAQGILIERLNIEDNLATGILTGSQAMVRDCRAFSNNGSGFNVGNDSQVENCSAVSNDAQGFVLGSRVRMRQCEAITNGVVGTFQGISAPAASLNGYIENCFVMGNDTGISISGTGWTVIRNVAKGNGTNYVIGAGNHAGSIVASPAGSGANDNISN